MHEELPMFLVDGVLDCGGADSVEIEQHCFML